MLISIMHVIMFFDIYLTVLSHRRKVFQETFFLYLAIFSVGRGGLFDTNLLQ